MTQIETVSFSCPSCGKRLRARAEQGGRIYACPGCGGAVPVPEINATSAPAMPEAAPTQPPADAGVLSRLPGSVRELAIVLFILWSAIAFVSLIVMFFGGIALYVGIIMFVLASLVAAQQVWQLLRAPQNVLTVKDVSLFWGTVRLVAWEPTEGILILRNKAITFRDDDLSDGKGGVRFIYPFLGEEVALRVPLEIQTVAFDDPNVPTREYLHLGIRGVMKWRIQDIEKFYLHVSRELRETSEKADVAAERSNRVDRATATSRRLIDASIAWLRSIAQEQTRSVVSRVRSGLLIADKVAAEMPEVRQSDSGNAELGGAAEGLSSAIHEAIAERLAGYGISITEVALVEIRMPQAIVEQCVEAARTAYLPLMAKNQASTREADLRAQANVIGRDALAAKELISAAPAYALRDFLSDVVAKNTNVSVALPAGTPTPPVATIDVAKLPALEQAEADTPAAPSGLAKG